MNTYLQTKEKRKFRLAARAANQDELSLKELLVCILIGLFAVVGVVCTLAAAARGIID